MITVKETVAAKIATTILGNYEVMDTMCSQHTGEWGIHGGITIGCN